MNMNDFEVFFNNFIGQLKLISGSKGTEYCAGSPDRLANFKRISQDLNISPEMVALIYLKKHLDSITNYVKTGKVLSDEQIQGRYYDLALYTILLAALSYERPASQDQVKDVKRTKS